MTGVNNTKPTAACAAEKGGLNMCKKKNCKRHEFDYGYCLPHLKKHWLETGTLIIEDAKPKRRRKKIDAVEVVTTDAAVEMEER